MGYQYSGKQTIEQELAAAQAEVEERRAAAAAAREQLRTLKAAKRQAEQIAAQQEATEKEIYRLAHGVRQLPPPVYGGRQGLNAAAREAAQHDRRKREMAAA